MLRECAREMLSIPARCILLFALACVAMILFQENVFVCAQAPRLKVGIYYQALCPDSKQFIRDHLYPVMIEDEWLEYADVQLVPYGRVTTWMNPFKNETSITCQHGTRECEMNALHACIVEHNPTSEQLRLIHCLMEKDVSLDYCSSQLRIPIRHAKRCKATHKVVELLLKYKVLTDALKLSIVPSITFNEEYDRFDQDNIHANFSGVFREKYKSTFNITYYRLEKYS